MGRGGRRVALAVLAATFVGSASGFVESTTRWARERTGEDPIRVLDGLLQARMAALARQSPTWRAGLDSLRASGFEVVIAAPAQVRAELPGMGRYDARHLGEVIPIRDSAGTITGAVVTVDLPQLGALALEAGLGAAELAGDVDRILIHEVYGHVVPLAASRQISGGCPDPSPGESALTSCAIVRENRIRSELGLAPRTTYDLSGLALGAALSRRIAAGTPQ